MDWMNYKVIQTMKESEKAVIMFTSLEDFEEPLIVKRLFEANPDVYRTISKLDNRHIPRIYDIEERPGEVVVVEEYIAGVTLDEYLKGKKPDDVQFLELMIQLCETLEFLHGCYPPVIHRDIKPSNILVDADGIIKIIDFDASRFYKKEKNTGDTRLLGTIEYAAPEQFGYAQTDARSDIYSVGVMFNEFEFGQNSHSRKQWKRIIGKCTGFDPENRYKNVACLKKDLKYCMLYAKHPLLVSGLTPMVAVLMIIVSILISTCLKPEENRETGMTPTSEPVADSKVTPEPTEVPDVTITPEILEQSGIVLEKNVLYWEEETALEISLKVRPEITEGIVTVYVCKSESEEDFSEVLLPLEEEFYTLSSDGRELCLNLEILNAYEVAELLNLFIELEDGRGEKVWIYRMTTKQ